MGRNGFGGNVPLSLSLLVTHSPPTTCLLGAQSCPSFLPCLMAPHSSTLAWKIHGWRSLVGCSPWGRKESVRHD